MRPAGEVVARLEGVSLRYGKVAAIDGLSLDLPASCMVGLIGPDGVGKSSVLALVAGTRRIQTGRVEVLGGDMRRVGHRSQVGPRIAYMPQGLGKNLYPTLSVFENVDFFGRLFGHSRAERERRIGELLESTGLAEFADRAVGKLSGGMKQKLGLCCALIHDPELLILDEPTTGVDPLSRRQFWELIDRVRAANEGMSVVVATSYMEEAERFDWLVAMNEGKVLATGNPAEMRAQAGAHSLEAAFIALLPEEKRRDAIEVKVPPRQGNLRQVAIEARGLTKRFGDFVAVDHVDFRIERGEIFGFLGSNGCGKTTTMKILTGLLPASEGEASLFGHPIDAGDLSTRRRVGYMSQSFSLYSELTVRQNLVLHARLFEVPRDEIAGRVERMATRFDLEDVIDSLSTSLPLDQRQRLSLAVALIHHPELLILDEPTSGVDPIARDVFWRHLLDLSRNDEVTIFISTHFVNEAARCDRISLMHAGKVLVSDTPEGLVSESGSADLEQAFIGYLEQAAGAPPASSAAALSKAEHFPADPRPSAPAAEGGTVQWFSLRRLMSYSRREALELGRDPIRLTLAVLGSVILMLIMGYGINMDVEELPFAVLDRDQTTVSRDYTLQLAGSRYFLEQPPLASYSELDRRMSAGELAVAIEIPPGFGRDLGRGTPVEIGVWLDGAMPMRAETVRGYVGGMHAHWLSTKVREELGQEARALASVETRFRYNPDVRSLVAMVPAMIPLLLLLIPAMLSTLSVVREKELGSIVNFYATPVTRLEFLLGKQIPYIVLGVANFILLTMVAVTLFGVPLSGSFLTLAGAALLYLVCATGMGLLISTFTRSQIAAVFATAVLTMIPAMLFSGMIDPVSSLEGAGAVVGQVFPTTHFLTISRGTFSKGLGFADLQSSFVPLLIAAPVLLALSGLLLKKQES